MGIGQTRKYLFSFRQDLLVNSFLLLLNERNFFLKLIIPGFNGIIKDLFYKSICPQSELTKNVQISHYQQQKNQI